MGQLNGVRVNEWRGVGESGGNLDEILEDGFEIFISTVMEWVNTFGALFLLYQCMALGFRTLIAFQLLSF